MKVELSLASHCCLMLASSPRNNDRYFIKLENQFDFRDKESVYAEIKMDSLTANQSKPYIRSLAVVTLVKPYDYLYAFYVQLEEIWFYEVSTGRIFSKLTPKESDWKIEDKVITKQLLDKAEKLYASGNNDEALKILRQVLTIEPMNAVAYYLAGSIHLRNGDEKAAINSLKTAIFWDNKIIKAYILLSKIYISRGECDMAKVYVNSAKKFSLTNQESTELQSLFETGKCK